VVRGVPDRFILPEEDHLRRFVPDARLPGDEIGESARFLDDDLTEKGLLLPLLRFQQLRPSRGGEASGGGVLEEEEGSTPAFFEGPAVVVFTGAAFRHGGFSLSSFLRGANYTTRGGGCRLAVRGTGDIMSSEGRVREREQFPPGNVFTSRPETSGLLP
jgi:hypothetical protein